MTPPSHDPTPIGTLSASRMYQDYARAFTRGTGLPLSLHAPELMRVVDFDRKEANPFCALMAKTNQSCAACYALQQRLEAEAQLEPKTLKCFAGLCETAVPVRVGDKLIAFLQTGQILLHRPNRTEFNKVAQTLLSFGAQVDLKRLEEAYFNKLKLRRWEMTDEQIAELLRTRKVSDRLTLVSPISGTVTEKMVVQKSAVKPGDVLYKLANLDSVWVYLDIYEYELPWVRYGQSVEITTEASPGETFTGRVWFINPVLTDESRTVKVLVNIANKDKKLKPGMFVSTTIRAALLVNGQLAPTGVEGQWTCAMHPQVLQPEGGECPVCKMALTQIPPVAKPASPEEELVLAVPTTAVLDSGVRKIAYVERSAGEYVAATLKLGARAGDYYPVIEGLKEGDRVAVRGNFLLDSQFQIRGLPSLFYEHGQAPAAGHQHGAAAEKPAPAAKPTGHEGHATPKPAEPKP